MTFRISLLTLFLFSAMCSHAVSKEYNLCKNLILNSEQMLTLSKNETLLICGDETDSEWGVIPESQSLFHLSNFLEERGIYTIEKVKKNGQLFVNVVKPIYSLTWKIEGSPRDWPATRLRGVTGQLLTPKLLDSVTERVSRSLESFGYACAPVKTEATPTTREIITRIGPVSKRNLLQIQDEKVEGLDILALERYNPFQLGELFNRDLILLSERRIEQDNIFQSTYSNVSCDPHGASVYRKHIAGPPNLFTFGFGLNTERGPLARAAWKHLRIGKSGSQIEVAISASLKSQEFSTFANWYASNSLKRFHLRPLITLKHENESVYERYTGELGLSPATSWDNQFWGIRATLGPSLNFSKSVRGLGPSDAKFLALGGGFTLTSHLFELYRNTPREGTEVSFETMDTFRSIGTSFDALRGNLRFTYLYNLKNWNPPFLVLGIRGALGATISSESIDSNQLPSNFRFFLGGSNTIRGFDRLEIPSEKGALTSAFASLEVRFADLFPWALEPLFFIDGGTLGSKAFSFDPALYWSPGAGMRWDSPIGVFRGTFAKGLVEGISSIQNKWTLFLSYGEEF